MAFDLFITISGLCLLVRRENELLVLLPKTHANHKHFAVLGSHQRYQPDATVVKNGFVEHHLARQTISFDDFDTDHAFNPDLDRYGIAAIEGGDVGDLLPENSYAKFTIADGAPCPQNLCAHARGGRWTYKGQTQTLATELHWRIREVSSDVDGSEGLGLKIMNTSEELQTVKLRPVNGQIRLYLFHTRADELPSENPPVPQHLPPGSGAQHFCHYYDLFKPGNSCVPPVLQEDELKTHGIVEVFRQAHDHIGRRYSCLLATFDDSESSDT